MKNTKKLFMSLVGVCMVVTSLSIVDQAIAGGDDDENPSPVGIAVRALTDKSPETIEDKRRTASFIYRVYTVLRGVGVL